MPTDDAPDETPDDPADHDEHHGHDHHHGHGHGHQHDQGIAGALRYLRRLPRFWRSDVNDAVVELLAPAPGERVLDIGAGMGAGSVRAVAAGADVVAVEPTPFMRRVLSVRRHLVRGKAQLEVVDGAAEALPVEDGTVDAIWAVNTMHHWIEPERGVGEIARVLRPGGRVILVDEDFADPAHPDHESFSARHAHDDHGFEMVDVDAMAALLRAAGFVDVEAGRRPLAGNPVILLSGRTAPAPTS